MAVTARSTSVTQRRRTRWEIGIKRTRQRLYRHSSVSSTRSKRDLFSPRLRYRRGVQGGAGEPRPDAARSREPGGERDRRSEDHLQRPAALLQSEFISLRTPENVSLDRPNERKGCRLLWERIIFFFSLIL